MRGLFAVGWGLLMVAACSAETVALSKALGEGCLLDSDCDGELVCVFRRCHEQCKTDQDCQVDLLCARGRADVNVCQLEDESRCVLDSDCLDDRDCASQLCQDNRCVPSVPRPAECVPNHQLSCDCGNNQTGIKICDAGGQWGPCNGCDCVVVAGTWSLEVTNINSSCGPEPDWNSPLNISQTGCTLEVTGVKLSSRVVNGSASGNQVIVGPGDYDEGTGTTTSTFTLTWVDANLLQGVEEWTWTDDTSTCNSGTADATATR